MYYCTLTDNSANDGGGADEGVLSTCTLTGNSAEYGGGAYGGVLYNCTLTGNRANEGGGAVVSDLKNCIVYHNQADSRGDNYSLGLLNYCCTTPLPVNGVGNISGNPAFVNQAAGDFHPGPDSPCINAGNNAAAFSPTDLDGNSRIVSGAVDIGAYEYQGPGSVISYAWLQQYGLPTDGSVDLVDSDNDQLNNWEEWIADTGPTNAQSLFRIDAIAPGPPVTVQFHSSSSRLYTLFYSPDPAGTNAMGATWANVAGQTDRPGTGGAFSLTDTNVTAPRFYRVEVRQP